MVGEVKPLGRVTSSAIAKILKELQHYLSVKAEMSIDWGHDFGFGLLYCGKGMPSRSGALVDWWEVDHIFISVLPA